MLTAIGAEIKLVYEVDPLKDKQNPAQFAPRLAATLEGWAKDDPASKKMLPVEVDVPEWLVWDSQHNSAATEKDRAVADWALSGFYYLLRIGEYTVKKSRNYSKQTRQFKMEDATFFQKDKEGRITKLRWDAPDEDILASCSATLKLDNQKNGYKNVCVHHHDNGDPLSSPTKALARRFIHIRANGGGPGTWLSAYYIDGVRHDIHNDDVSVALKWAARELDYPTSRNIPLDRIDTHSLRVGGACALALAGYSDTQIQKMGRWKSATFKEYIREELHCYSEGMSKGMKKMFGFVNISGGGFQDVTQQVMEMEPNQSAPAA